MSQQPEELIVVLKIEALPKYASEIEISAALRILQAKEGSATHDALQKADHKDGVRDGLVATPEAIALVGSTHLGKSEFPELAPSKASSPSPTGRIKNLIDRMKKKQLEYMALNGEHFLFVYYHQKEFLELVTRARAELQSYGKVASPKAYRKRVQDYNAVLELAPELKVKDDHTNDPFEWPLLTLAADYMLPENPESQESES